MKHPLSLLRAAGRQPARLARGAAEAAAPHARRAGDALHPSKRRPGQVLVWSVVFAAAWALSGEPASSLAWWLPAAIVGSYVISPRLARLASGVEHLGRLVPWRRSVARSARMERRHLKSIMEDDATTRAIVRAVEEILVRHRGAFDSRGLRLDVARVRALDPRRLIVAESIYAEALGEQPRYTHGVVRIRRVWSRRWRDTASVEDAAGDVERTIDGWLLNRKTPGSAGREEQTID